MYHPCVERKLRNINFNKPSFKATKTFDVVHSYVCSMDTESIGVNEYFATFTEGFTSYFSCFTIKYESQAFKI